MQQNTKPHELPMPVDAADSSSLLGEKLGGNVSGCLSDSSASLPQNSNDHSDGQQTACAQKGQTIIDWSISCVLVEDHCFGWCCN